MLRVLEVAKHVFWNDSMYDRQLLPPRAALEACRATLADMSTMTGRERLQLFDACGIDPLLWPLFLRSLQHLTAHHGCGSIDDGYAIHRHLSARMWSPHTPRTSLLGVPVVQSEPYRATTTTGASGAAVTASPAADDGADATPTSSLRRASEVRYNGLFNQGATCYLNSLLQALFHLSAFRRIIYTMPTEDEAARLSTTTTGGGAMAPSKSIPYALQRLFCQLQTSTTAVGTRELTESFGWSAADSFTQHDVHEMTRVLLDNLQEKLTAQQQQQQRQQPSRGEDGDNAILTLFNGTLESYIRVDEVHYRGARSEAFYDLQLVVKDKPNIYASLDAFFAVEVLDGKNKYCLEHDGTKSYHRAEKGVRLTKTPPILLLHLTRFDYDVQQGETKVLTRWDYYHTLDLSRYMPDAPARDTHYTLCSVLVHAGVNTGFGHYFCFVRCGGSGGSWYKFNDEVVTLATLRQVFGDNFGGYRLNYWGSEVPQTTNAYMLIYVRTCALDELLRPITAAELPQHVVTQLAREHEAHKRLLREMAEDHLYGRLHLLTPRDLPEHEELLCGTAVAARTATTTTSASASSSSSTQPPQLSPHTTRAMSALRTLRLRLDAEARPALAAEVAVTTTAAADGDTTAPRRPLLLWCAAVRTTTAATSHGDEVRMGKLLQSGTTVKDVLGNASEAYVLATTPDTAPYIDLVDDDVDDEYVKYAIVYHKLYNATQLRVSVLGCTVLRQRRGDDQSDAAAVLAMIEPHVRTLIAQQQQQHKDSAMTTATATLRVLREDGQARAFVECDTLTSGDVLVWQRVPDAADGDGGAPHASVLYPDIVHFQHFLRHRIPVEIKLNSGPAYATLVDTELADDMTYEQLQVYVAQLLGRPAEYDRIRFTRHNPDTNMPYFMKGKKRDRPTLAKLLTPASSHYTTLSRVLYYEYCKYTVSEIEASHSLQFKVYGDNVKPLSAHWILMPRNMPITAMQLFSYCLAEVQRDYASQLTAQRDEDNNNNGSDDGGGSAGQGVSSLPRASSTAALATNETTTTTTTTTKTAALTRATSSEELTSAPSTKRFVDFLMHLDCNDAWMHLRLVDVWRSRIFNVLDRNHALVFEHQTFEESAEYRIERIPAPLPGVPLEEQMLVQVQHFTHARQRRDAVEVHGEPFSMYVADRELPGDLLQRIADKLEMSYAAVVDWKVCLVRDTRVVETRGEVAMGQQLRAFCDVACYEPNQREANKAAFVGLEHARAVKRGGRREEKVVILH